MDCIGQLALTSGRSLLKAGFFDFVTFVVLWQKEGVSMASVTLMTEIKQGQLRTRVTASIWITPLSHKFCSDTSLRFLFDNSKYFKLYFPSSANDSSIDSTNSRFFIQVGSPGLAWDLEDLNLIPGSLHDLELVTPCLWQECWKDTVHNIW